MEWRSKFLFSQYSFFELIHRVKKEIESAINIHGIRLKMAVALFHLHCYKIVSSHIMCNKLAGKSQMAGKIQQNPTKQLPLLESPVCCLDINIALYSLFKGLWVYLIFTSIKSVYRSSDHIQFEVEFQFQFGKHFAILKKYF